MQSFELVSSDGGDPDVKNTGEKKIKFDREHQSSPRHRMVQEVGVCVEMVRARVEVKVSDSVDDNEHDQE